MPFSAIALCLLLRRPEKFLFLNKTGFYYAFMGNEVEFYDLAGITGIECFCSKPYSWIQNNRMLLCGDAPQQTLLRNNSASLNLRVNNMKALLNTTNYYTLP